jgi:hypothetical protein
MYLCDSEDILNSCGPLDIMTVDRGEHTCTIHHAQHPAKLGLKRKCSFLQFRENRLRNYKKMTRGAA